MPNMIFWGEEKVNKKVDSVLVRLVFSALSSSNTFCSGTIDYQESGGSETQASPRKSWVDRKIPPKEKPSTSSVVDNPNFVGQIFTMWYFITVFDTSRACLLE